MAKLGKEVNWWIKIRNITKLSKLALHSLKLKLLTCDDEFTLQYCISNTVTRFNGIFFTTATLKSPLLTALLRRFGEKWPYKIVNK